MEKTKVNSLNVDSKLLLFVRGMEDDKKLFDNAVSEKKRDDAFIYFYHFLCDLFALREKCGYDDITHVQVGNKKKQQPVKDDSIYGALKNIYESIKHTDDIDVSFDLNLYVSSASYPRTYTFCYGKAHIDLVTVTNTFLNARAKGGNELIKKESITNLHHKYLENKNVSQIMAMCIKECSDLPNRIKDI